MFKNIIINLLVSIIVVISVFNIIFIEVMNLALTLIFLIPLIITVYFNITDYRRKNQIDNFFYMPAYLVHSVLLTIVSFVASIFTDIPTDTLIIILCINSISLSLICYISVKHKSDKFRNRLINEENLFSFMLNLEKVLKDICL